ILNVVYAHSTIQVRTGKAREVGLATSEGDDRENNGVDEHLITQSSNRKVLELEYITASADPSSRASTVPGPGSSDELEYDGSAAFPGHPHRDSEAVTYIPPDSTGAG
ncbi:hypothetical protein FOL47_010908, partial [Perkinsus chesapeaki]